MLRNPIPSSLGSAGSNRPGRGDRRWGPVVTRGRTARNLTNMDSDRTAIVPQLCLLPLSDAHLDERLSR
jgi:hypothetical protein